MFRLKNGLGTKFGKRWFQCIPNSPRARFRTSSSSVALRLTNFLDFCNSPAGDFHSACEMASDEDGDISNAREAEDAAVALDFGRRAERFLEIVGEFDRWVAVGIVEFANEA